MKHLHTTLTILLLLPLTAQASPLREQVERALSGIEYVPTQQDLLRLDPRVDRVLRDIVIHPSRRHVLARTRAVTLLRLFPSNATRTTLERVIAATGQSKSGLDLLNLRQALTSYAVVAGAVALPRLKPFLAHPSMDVRYDAATAVRLTRSPAAPGLLQQRSQVEQSPMVRHQLRRQVELIRRPPL